MYNQSEEGNPISAQGYLITHVYTSDAMIPLEDSTVTITQKQLDGIEELLAIRITDESGNTERIAVQTPDLSASQAPAQETPFSTVDVTAEHPLYERIVVENVQVFPNTVTRQDLQMIPLNEMPEAWNQTEIFDVPPQNL